MSRRQFNIPQRPPAVRHLLTTETRTTLYLHHYLHQLTHWGRMTHICVGKLTIIGSDNGLSPGRRQAIIWTNAGLLLIRHLGTNFSEILIGISNIFIQENGLENVVCEMASILSRPQCVNKQHFHSQFKIALQLNCIKGNFRVCKVSRLVKIKKYVFVTRVHADITNAISYRSTKEMVDIW